MQKLFVGAEIISSKITGHCLNCDAAENDENSFLDLALIMKLVLGTVTLILNVVSLG